MRERKGDIPLLSRHFVSLYSKKYNKNVSSISEAALARMQGYHWPGNIRELQHAIERAVIMSNQTVLQPQDFDYSSPSKSASRTELKLDSYRLDEIERIMIKKALDKNNGNITLTAKELGLTRTSLYRRLEKHGL